MSLEERMSAIEKEIRETPYHKGTEHHIGKLKARLAKLKKRLLEKHVRSVGTGFAVKKEGDATVILLGPPSVGKSTLINSLTAALSKVGDYDFTTVQVIPGMLFYQGAKIQILDIPGFIHGGATGKGRGKEILSVIRSADLLLLVVDVKTISQIEGIQKELGKKGVGVGKPIPILIVVNKVDLATKKESLKLRKKERIYLSAKTGEGLAELKKAIWQKLNLIRVFLKPPDGKIDWGKPLILKKGATVWQAAEKISQNLVEDLKSARVWGPSVKFAGQQVSLSHNLADGDILSLIKK